MKFTVDTPLGNIEYSEENRISLPRGLPGFETARIGVWFASPEYDPIKWLLLEDEDGALLPLIDPFLIRQEYEPVVPDHIVELLEIDSAESVAVMCVATPRKNQPPTVNLRSPIIINAAKRKATQIILGDESLPIRFSWNPEAEEASQC